MGYEQDERRGKIGVGHDVNKTSKVLNFEMEEIENKVAKSGLITLNLEDFYPKGERILFDIKDLLFEGLLLKEKDFRASVTEIDWQLYQDKYVSLHCSTDAIVPTWAYMLLTVELEQCAKKIVLGDLDVLETVLFNDALSKINVEQYRDERIVIKGCSAVPVPESAYIELTRLLRPIAKSIMYGEACSTVPLYKKK